MKGTSSWSKLNSGLESPRLKSENISTSKKSNGGSAVSFGTVVDCLYIDEQRQGEITFSSPQMGQHNAYPLNPNLKNYPVAGEQVIVFSVPKNVLKVNESGGPFHGQDGFYFYQTINIWNNPNLNAVKKSSQFTNLGVPFYFPLNKSQGIFPLTACVGDVILEVRLGNTDRSVPNTWSQDGISGDPITIIRNGQSPQGLTGGIEDIKDDLASLYLTSYQKLSQLSLINENFKSYKTEPLTPASYQDPQVVLNSSRIILNAKKDDILISAQNSVGLSSNGTINIESTSDDGTIIDGNIKLGKKSADEPVLLGYQTTVLLKQLITEVRNISLALEVNQVFPEGTPAGDGTNISVASSAVKTCNTLLERLTVKSTNGKQ